MLCSGKQCNLCDDQCNHYSSTNPDRLPRGKHSTSADQYSKNNRFLKDTMVGDDAFCHPSDPRSCVPGQAVQNGNGVKTGKCVNSLHPIPGKPETNYTCEIEAWCPVEFDIIPAYGARFHIMIMTTSHHYFQRKRSASIRSRKLHTVDQEFYSISQVWYNKVAQYLLHVIIESTVGETYWTASTTRPTSSRATITETQIRTVPFSDWVMSPSNRT
jgi:hypothetical protein